MIDYINGSTRVYGIIGSPVGHSLSPLMHNAAFQYLKINAVYVPFDVKKVTRSLGKAISSLGIGGLSVTIPHKTWAASIADNPDPLTQRCGAANTLIPEENGSISAYNTDGPGAIRALKTVENNIRGKRILLIGYGGSATAIAHTLLLEENPASLIIAGRNGKKREAFRDSLKKIYENQHTLIRSTDYSDFHPEEVDIIIHTTPLGMKGKPAELPLPVEFIQKYHTVYDIVYNPARTPLLTEAEKVGARTVRGYLMLLYQAVIQFELFTGQKAPESLMEKELLSALRKQQKK